MDYPAPSSYVKFVYVPKGERLPELLDSSTIYFDENTQRLLVAGVNIYNPVVYKSDPIISPEQVLLTQEEYNALTDAEYRDDVLYIIYEPGQIIDPNG